MRASLVFALPLLPLAAAPSEAAPRSARSPQASNPTLGLPEMHFPIENAPSPDKVALGRRLYWDARLSRSGKTSCFTCHQPAQGWADGQQLSKKDDGSMNTRHTPTLLNAAYATSFYWDGRAPTLEKQIAAAWRAQMGVKDDAGAAEVAKRLGEIRGYQEPFQKIFNQAPTPDNIVKALASYVRTLISGDSRYDRFEAGNPKAYTPAQRRGAEIFKTKAKCSLCHAGALLTAYEFKNIGIGMDSPSPDPGRGKIEPQNLAMQGAFRVPTLRNVARHPPYMHDGRFASLADVVEYFAQPITGRQLDEKVKGGIRLKPREKQDLIEFLKALDGSEPDPTPPDMPP